MAKTEILYYIEAWYNKRRKHSSLGFISLEEFEQKHKLANVA